MDEATKAGTGPSDGTTLIAILDGYASAGFVTDFLVDEEGQIRCGECDTQHDPEALTMDSLRRLEGASDPADMLAVVALTCPACSARGTAVLTFGPEATAGEGRALVAFGDARDVGGSGLDGSRAPHEPIDQPGPS